MEETANLIDDRHVTVAMVADPWSWRIRAVEEISVDTATTCLRRRSLQGAPLRPLLGDRVSADATHALVGLYVAPMPRGPLLEYDVTGPDDGPASLLPRVEIAERQVLYLQGLADSCGQAIDDDLHELLAAVCRFTGEQVNGGESLATYLLEGLGRSVPSASVDAWKEVGDACRDILRPRLDVFAEYSAPENPALVLPGLFADGVVVDDDTATALLRRYRTLVEDLSSLADASEPNAAGEFLDSLADYANYYDLVVATRVPLDEPFLVKYSERRDMKLSSWRNTGSQNLVVADARTNHVTFKVPDPNVRIRSFQARQPGTTSFAYGLFKSRSDSQNRAFYAHDPDRGYRVELVFKLASLPRLQAVPYFVAGLLALLTVALWLERATDLRSLALVAGPAALGASVLLAREPSTLGSKLRAASSVVVVVALIALVGSSVVLFAGGLGKPTSAPGCQCPVTKSVPDQSPSTTTQMGRSATTPKTLPPTVGTTK